LILPTLGTTMAESPPSRELVTGYWRLANGGGYFYEGL